MICIICTKNKHVRYVECDRNWWRYKKVNCRHYKGEPGGGHSLVREFSGRGHSPFHPDHNSSYLYTRGSLYAATVADFSATDSLIIKNQLRTEQYDYMHLNSPDFVGSLEDDEHVYFFFREAAVEFMNCGKAVYSRVARVCKNDEGGSHKFANRSTSIIERYPHPESEKP